MSELTRLQVIALRDLAFSCLPEAEQERIHRNAKVSGMGDVAYKTDFSAMGAFPSVRLEPTLPPTKTAIEQGAGKVLFLTTRHPLTYTPHPTSTPEEIQREQEVAERDRAVIEQLLCEAVAELCELAEVAPPHWLQQGQPDSIESQDDAPEQDSGHTAPRSVQWVLKTPDRWDSLTTMIHPILKAEHSAGRPKPKPLFVMEAIEQARPPDFHSLVKAGGLELKYLDSNGEIQTANSDAIRQRINRMTDPGKRTKTGR